MRPGSILESYPVMMCLGLVLGILLGGFPAYTKEISMASLALAMTLSLSTVSLVEAKGKDHLNHAARALIVNYVVLTALILVIALFFSKDLRNGWILMAAAPSAVSVVPFTTILGGQTTKALFSTAVNYIVALALMPILTLIMIGSGVSTIELVYSLLLLIALPMALSRGVIRLKLSKPANSSLMNLSFAVLIFAVAGANRSAFVGEPYIVLAVALGGVVRTFGIGLGTEFALRNSRCRSL